MGKYKGLCSSFHFRFAYRSILIFLIKVSSGGQSAFPFHFNWAMNHNFTNITQIDDDWLLDCDQSQSLLDQAWVRYPTMAIYISVFIICLLGNLFTIIVILAHPLMLTSTNFFLCNLAVADLLVAVFCILQNMIHIVGFDHANWPLGETMCKMYVLVLHLVPCTSVGILVCVSIEKYIAVLHPLTALKILTQRLRIMVTIGIWIISLLTNLVYFFSTKEFVFGDKRACSRTDEMPLWVTISFVIWYVIPLLVLAFIYSKIGFLLWTTGGSSLRTNRQSSADSQGSVGASWNMGNGRVIVYKQESLLQVPEEKPARRRQRQYMEGRRKVIRLLFFVVLSFAVLTLPHHARLLEAMWYPAPTCNSDYAILLQPLSYICLFVSSAINPILYAFLSRRFREAVSEILYCRRGLFTRISRSRTRTLVSDVPDDSRSPSPHPRNNTFRLNRLR